MTFEELWKQVSGHPDVAKIQVLGALKEDTKKMLASMKPEEVAAMVASAIGEVNRGSIKPLDELIRERF